jgi:pilus assembly protein CpaF
MAKRLIIFSTKGGVGKTFIAVNLATSLASGFGKKTCLIDLDMSGSGDAARMLDFNPQKAIIDLLPLLKKEQAGPFPKSNFIVHSSFGLDFLSGILKPQQSPLLEAEKLKDVFALLDKDYDYIIVDAGNSFNEVFLTVLNQSNLILLVTTPDILALHQVKLFLEPLQLLHIPMAMVKIVLNRAESASSISWQEVSLSLPCDIIAQVPSEGKVAGLAINRGIPLVIDNPRSKITLAIKKLTNELVNNEGLFIEHLRIDQIKLKEIAPDKAVDIWDRERVIEPARELDSGKKPDAITILKRRIHDRLIEELDLKRMDSATFSDYKKTKELRDKAEMTVTNLLTEEAGSFIPSAQERKKLVKEILDESLGLGPLEDLLADPEITDIMVNNRDEIYVERHGKIELTDKRFISDAQVKSIIERIIAPIGRHIDESVPMVDARLPDGSRVNAIIPPLALNGPTLTIRKFRKEKFKIEDLISLNSLNKNMADFICASVITRKNIIVSGGTGSGKTTMLNLLSGFIPAKERIVTIEDAAELKLDQEHWIRLESRPPNIEGKGSVSIRELFRNTLRMRPDRVIIGECRGIETLDMLQAMNTGHDGSMTTIHANSTHDVLSRLDSMILMSGVELPIRAIREMIASAIHLIIHTARLSDGSRKVIQITEVAGMKDELHIDLRDIFIFKQTGTGNNGEVLGDFQATGYTPSFIEDFRIKGISLPADIFKTP